MPLVTTAGTKIYIGGAIADQDEDFTIADFPTTGEGTITWVEIGGTSNLGTIGDKSTLISDDFIGVSRTKKAKGTRNAGTTTIVCGLDYADAGQVAALAAVQSDSNFAFKIAFKDAPAGGTPSERYFIALVMGAEEVFAGANDGKKLNIELEVNSNIVKVNAAADGDAPDNTVLPAITGTAQAGVTLAASSGTWTGTATISYAYQWFKDGESIADATGATYDVLDGDVGSKISVEVTATNGIGSARAISAQTATVIAA